MLAWARRPDAPAKAGGPARPVPVTETDVSVLIAAEYPGLPEVKAGPGAAEVRQHVDLLDKGVDAGTATALDQMLLARERGWLADLDAERAAHQSWVDAITADALSRKSRLDAEMRHIEREIDSLDRIVADASERLRSPERRERKQRRRTIRVGRPA